MHLIELIQVGPSIDLPHDYFLRLLVIEEKYLIFMFERHHHALYVDIVERRKKLTVNKMAELCSQQILHIEVVLSSSLLIPGLD